MSACEPVNKPAETAGINVPAMRRRTHPGRCRFSMKHNMPDCICVHNTESILMIRSHIVKENCADRTEMRAERELLPIAASVL